MLDRYLAVHGDGDVLREFYPSMKRATVFMAGLNRGPDGIISMPDRKVSATFGRETEWFEHYDWQGMATHVGGIHLATLQMAEGMAARVGDEEFAGRCRDWLDQGQNSLETRLWNGDSYLNFWDPAKDIRSDHIFAYQLDGEWMSRFHGLSGVFRPDRVSIVLDTVERYNVTHTRIGAISYVRADGTVQDPGEWPMLGGGYEPYDLGGAELYVLAMTYMYAGKRELGLERAHRFLRNAVERGVVWDMPGGVRGDTGDPLSHDYYQGMMLWSLPAALGNDDLRAPTRPGGLVDRVLQAARSEGPGGADHAGSG